MKGKIPLIFSAIIVVYGAIHVYIGWHILILLETLHIHQPVGISFFVGLLAFSFLIGRLGKQVFPHFLTESLNVLGAYWMAVLMYLIILLPIADMASLLMDSLSIRREVYIPFLGFFVVFIILLILFRGSWNAWNPVVRKYDIQIQKKAGNREHLRIVVASDLHLGSFVDNRHLQRLIGMVKDLQPDLFLLPGDVLDHDIDVFIRNGMPERMKELGTHARLGTYAVLGNHEYIGGTVPQYLDEMEKIGIKVLVDETVLIDHSMYLVGRNDRIVESGRFGGSGRKTHSDLLAGVDQSLPIMMMDHQPYQLDKAAESGVDILLSGHTHRGQMAPNHWITGRLFELDWGYLKKGELHAFVSSGFGTWGPPIRIGSRSEILDIHVHFSKDKA